MEEVKSMCPVNSLVTVTMTSFFLLFQSHSILRGVCWKTAERTEEVPAISAKLWEL